MSQPRLPEVAASVRDRLLHLARSRGETYDLLLNRFASERFLYRLTVSGFQDRLILKGAMLLYLWGGYVHRSTRDLDFLARGDVSLEAIEGVIRQICSTNVEPDGLTFDLTGMRVEEIREQSEYGGVRARFLAILGSARISMQLDFGVGDAVTPSAVEIRPKSLLDFPVNPLLTYPLETVVAEKLETIVNFGMANSRMKDYFDLWVLINGTDFEHVPLARAVWRTFERRARPIPLVTPIGLSDSFSRSQEKQHLWKAFETRSTGAHAEFKDVVRTIREFAAPLFKTASEL